MSNDKSTAGTEAPASNPQPCGMWPSGVHGKDCGQPAYLGQGSVSGGLIPMCEDCIAWTGVNRKYLKRLP